MTTPTLSQLGEMTDEELKRTLAPLVGWTEVGPFLREEGEIVLGGMMPGHKRSEDDVPAKLPDYPNDANAVAEVRKGLSTPQAGKFIDSLYILLSPEPINGRPFSWLMMNAELRLQVIALITALTP